QESSLDIGFQCRLPEFPRIVTDQHLLRRTYFQRLRRGICWKIAPLHRSLSRIPMISELRHLTSINDLTDSEIDGVFRVADRILANVGDQAKDHSGRLIRPYRIAKSSDEARGLI